MWIRVPQKIFTWVPTVLGQPCLWLIWHILVFNPLNVARCTEFRTLLTAPENGHWAPALVRQQAPHSPLFCLQRMACYHLQRISLSQCSQLITWTWFGLWGFLNYLTIHSTKALVSSCYVQGNAISTAHTKMSKIWFTSSRSSQCGGRQINRQVNAKNPEELSIGMWRTQWGWERTAGSTGSKTERLHRSLFKQAYFNQIF